MMKSRDLSQLHKLYNALELAIPLCVGEADIFEDHLLEIQGDIHRIRNVIMKENHILDSFDKYINLTRFFTGSTQGLEELSMEERLAYGKEHRG